MKVKDTMGKVSTKETEEKPTPLPAWITVLIVIAVVAVLIFYAVITYIKWSALAKNPQLLRDVALAQVAGNTAVGIFGRGQPYTSF